MQIKQITDAETLFKLEQQNFSDFYSFESCVQELENCAKTYYYAQENNKIIGYVGIMQVFGEAEILRIAVNKEHRNKGVAQVLFNFIIEKLKQKNIKNLFLEVSDKNLPAQNFYKKNDFKEIYTRKNYYSDNSNAIIMQRGI